MLLTKLSDSSYGSYKNIVTLWIQPFSQARFNHWFLSFRRTISTRFHFLFLPFPLSWSFPHSQQTWGCPGREPLRNIYNQIYLRIKYPSILFDIIIFGSVYLLTADIFVICGDVLKRLHWAGVM